MDVASDLSWYQLQKQDENRVVWKIKVNVCNKKGSKTHRLKDEIHRRQSEAVKEKNLNNHKTRKYQNTKKQTTMRKEFVSLNRDQKQQ